VEVKRIRIISVSKYSHNGQTGLLQIFYNNRLEAKYARIRFYEGYKEGKPQYIYSKVEITAEIQALLDQKLHQKGIGQQQSNAGQQNNIEPQNLKNKPKSKIKSGRSLVWLGHQPATLTTRVRIPATAPFFT
jgi:hypothetical protein